MERSLDGEVAAIDGKTIRRSFDHGKEPSPLHVGSAWEEWLRFFLRGVQEMSNQATEAARSILELFDQDRERIDSELGRAAGSGLRVHELLQRRSIVNTSEAVKELSLTRPTIISALENLQELGIVRELTGKQRYRVYTYDRYFSILDEGTAPIEP